MNDPVTVTYDTNTLETWMCTPGGEFELEEFNGAIDEAVDRAKLFGEATVIVRIIRSEGHIPKEAT